MGTALKRCRSERCKSPTSGVVVACCRLCFLLSNQLIMLIGFKRMLIQKKTHAITISLTLHKSAYNAEKISLQASGQPQSRWRSTAMPMPTATLEKTFYEKKEGCAAQRHLTSGIAESWKWTSACLRSSPSGGADILLSASVPRQSCTRTTRSSRPGASDTSPRARRLHR